MKRIRRLPEMEMEMEMRIPMHSEMPIPMDVVTDEILTRLPAKSLMRFKCDVNAQRSSVRLSLVPDAYNSDDTPSSSSFVVDLTIPRMRGGYICQNLRGFICYDLWEKPCIFNPATRQLVTLPPAFNPSTTKGTVSYSGTRPYYEPVQSGLLSWCPFDRYARGKVPSSCLCPQIRRRRRRFLEKGESPSSSGLYSSHCGQRRRVSHDFKMIQVPRAGELPSPAKLKNVCLVEYGGKVTVVDQTNLKGMLDLWALENAASQKWLSKRLVLKPSQLDFFRNTEFVVREQPYEKD
ncbi:hypothetical protein Bca4012_064438 [Brassica carinata]